MKKLIVLTFSAVLLMSAAIASAGYFNGPLPPNHHIHDCTTAPVCTYPHLSVGFFPKILTGGDVLAYLGDPAECNDATDKSLLPPNEDTQTPTEDQPLRAGVCYTKTTLIHLRSIDVGDPAPEGWSGPIAPVTLANHVTYVTYYLLTPR